MKSTKTVKEDTFTRLNRKYYNFCYYLASLILGKGILGIRDYQFQKELEFIAVILSTDGVPKRVIKPIIDTQLKILKIRSKGRIIAFVIMLVLNLSITHSIAQILKYLIK